MQMQIHMDILSGRRQCGILKIMVNWKSGGLVFYLGFAINLLFSFHFIFKNTMGVLHYMVTKILSRFKRTQWPQMRKYVWCVNKGKRSYVNVWFWSRLWRSSQRWLTGRGRCHKETGYWKGLE